MFISTRTDAAARLRRRMRSLRLIGTLSALAALTGCTSLTGLSGASDEFSCPRGEAGTPCTSMQLVHAASVGETLPMNPQALDAARTRAMTRPVKAGTSLWNGVSDAGPEPWAGVGLREDEFDDQKAVRSLSRGKSGKDVDGENAGAAPAARLYRPAPVRIPERLLLVWISPYQDEDGDLHEGHNLWVTLSPARWRTVEAKKGRGPAWSRSLPGNAGTRPLMHDGAGASEEPGAGARAAVAARASVEAEIRRLASEHKSGTEGAQTNAVPRQSPFAEAADVR